MVRKKYETGLVRHLNKKIEENEALRKHIIKTFHQTSKDFSSAFPSLIRLELAGSIARGDFSNRSDIDVVAFGLQKDEYFRFHNYLEELIKKKIDLIILEELSESDKVHILKNKELVYDRKKSRHRNLKNTQR